MTVRKRIMPIYRGLHYMIMEVWLILFFALNIRGGWSIQNFMERNCIMKKPAGFL